MFRVKGPGILARPFLFESSITKSSTACKSGECLRRRDQFQPCKNEHNTNRNDIDAKPLADKQNNCNTQNQQNKCYLKSHPDDILEIQALAGTDSAGPDVLIQFTATAVILHRLRSAIQRKAFGKVGKITEKTMFYYVKLCRSFVIIYGRSSALK